MSLLDKENEPEPDEEEAMPTTDEEDVVDEPAAEPETLEAEPRDKPSIVFECDTLSRWYGQVIAVNNLTVDVRPGITGLLGPNGAGKTSLMKIAVGLLKPSNGTIKVLGENPWNNPKLLSRIGYVPEADAPWRELTGREAAVRAGRLSGLDEAAAQEAVTAALGEVGLEDVADRRVDGYSRGMRQRLKFALALLHKPDLFILDEPLLGTDPETRVHLIDVIRRLETQGKSILISTHVLTDVEAMTQRILLLNRGRLMAYGDVAEIRDVLEQYPRTVRITTSDPRSLGAALWPKASVLSVEAEQGAVRVRTRDPKVFFEDLQGVLTSGGVPFTSVVTLDENLEAVFRYLVE